MNDRTGQQIGNYRLVRLLGKGGFAEVYLGEHVHLATQAAIKVLLAHLDSPGDAEHFRREAQTIARLTHPHIIRVLDFDVEQGVPFLVMEYASRGSLRAHLPRGTPVPLPTVVNYTRQVAEALQHAHEHRLIHRDVKPDNMLVHVDGRLVLSDFGIVTIAHSTSSHHLTENAGTVSYMAPEQMNGEPRPASDQYALAVCVYEWISGQLPFRGTAVEVAMQHTLKPPPSLLEQVPTLPAAVEHVVFTGLAKDSHARFASVQAFATALEQGAQDWQDEPTLKAFLPSEGPMRSSSVAPPVTLEVMNQPSVPPPFPLVTEHPQRRVDEEVPATWQTIPSAPSNVSPAALAPQALPSKRQRSYRARNVLLLALALLLIGAAGVQGFRLWSTSGLGSGQPGLAETGETATPTATPTPPITPSPTATPLPGPYGGTLIFSDPMTDNSRGNEWSVGTFGNGASCSFQNGQYRVHSTATWTAECATTRQQFVNIAVQADIAFVADPGSSCEYGIYLRWDGQNAYVFRVQDTGRYYLVVGSGGKSTFPPAFSGSDPSFRPGLHQSNTVVALAQGTTLKLYINGHLLNTISDSTVHGPGVLDFEAEYYSVSGVACDVSVSNVSVWS
jgi:serine/threonine protein kinase